MKRRRLADSLFIAVVAVPLALVAAGAIELAILALVALLVAAGLVASSLPEAPFRCYADEPDDGDRPPVVYPARAAGTDGERPR